MKALDRKLLRDLRTLWSQALTIALVVASGIGGFLTSLSAVDSLAAARDRYYAQAHFADLFASVKRAPLALAEQLRASPGVADVQTTLEQVVRLQLDGSADPALGQLIGLSRLNPARLNQLTLVAGRGLFDDLAGSRDGGGDGGGDVADGALPPPSGGAELPALVSRGFAQARGLKPGDSLGALVNGRQRRLRIVGLALSPEFIFAGLFGMPDQRGFGIFWVDQAALAAAWDMQGAFNTLAVRLAPAGVRDVPEAAVIANLTEPLARYGGNAPRGRADQASHAMLDNEIATQRLMGVVLPSIFLGVAAFLLNVVVSRLVTTQREQIAALKALGYDAWPIAAHYLKLVLAIVLLGLIGGVLLGDQLGRALLGLYAENFHFPQLQHRLDAGLVALACGITVLTAVAGTLSAILATVRLTPAQAMRPPAPGHYRRTLVERLGITGLSPALRMVLRNIERKPWRTVLGLAGVAAAVAIVVLGNFFRDAIETIVDTEFQLKMRSDVSVWLNESADASLGLQLARLPGVLQVEPNLFAQAQLVHGHRREWVQLRAAPAQPELYRIIDLQGRAAAPPPDGLLLTDRLAHKLGLQPGDRVGVILNTGRLRQGVLTVHALLPEMMGLNAYMTLDAFNRANGEGARVSGFTVTLQRGSEAAFLAATQRLPKVAGAFSKATMKRNLQQVTARNVRIMSTVMTLFAAVIAVGVVYNNARIALAERAWELASLRVLGFTRAEVTTLLLGEQGLILAAALPLGMALGWALVHVLAVALTNDQFMFPVVIQPRTYAVAALAVLAAAVASAAVVRRHIHRIDMVSALKTRE